MEECFLESHAAILQSDFILIIEGKRSELEAMNDSLIALVENLNHDGGLLDEAAANLKIWLEGGFLTVASTSALKELLESEC